MPKVLQSARSLVTVLASAALVPADQHRCKFSVSRHRAHDLVPRFSGACRSVLVCVGVGVAERVGVWLVDA